MHPAELLSLVDALVARGISPTEAARAAAQVAKGPTVDRLMSPEELAALVGRSPRTVSRWMRNETIPTVKADGAVVGVHFPTFLAVCTKYAQPRWGRDAIRAGDISANLVRASASEPTTPGPKALAGTGR